ALMNQKAAAEGHAAVGFINPALYALARGPNYSSYFHDITIGNNTNSTSPTGYFAVAGFDLCTGWGTPFNINLLTALALPDSMGILPATGFSANGPIGGPFNATSQTFTITNSGASSYGCAVVGRAPWLGVTPTAGSLAPSAGTNVTVSLNTAAGGFAAGTFNANIIFSNLTSHFAQTRGFNLSIGNSLVLNGGFESGDFSYWTLGGDAADNFVDNGNASTVSPRSGDFAAALGQISSLGSLYQPLPTLAGQSY